MTIEVFRPAIGEDEIRAATAVLRSGWIGRGTQVAELERSWAAYLGVPAEQVVALNCATEALFQVMAALPQTGRREVLMPANSYIGTANAALAAGLAVALCDVDAHSLNPTVAVLETALGEQTLAVAIQHYGGVPTDQESIESLCAERGVYLIEDCACAPASMCYGMQSGVGGDFGIWSFDAMKVMTAIDGAMLYCKDPAVAARIRTRTLLGQSVASGREQAGGRWWEFSVAEPEHGRRCIMNDVQAAVGLAQLRDLQDLVLQRRLRWHGYHTSLAHLPWLTLPTDLEPGICSSYYTYWVQLEQRDALAQFLRERGIYTTYRYWPVHRAYGWQADVPQTDWAAAHTLNLPLYPGLSQPDLVAVCEAIEAFGRIQ